MDSHNNFMPNYVIRNKLHIVFDLSLIFFYHSTYVLQSTCATYSNYISFIIETYLSNV